MNAKKSQGESKRKTQAGAEVKGKTTDDRQRVYAFLAYEDSSYPDWMERLDQEHITALVSPLHDQDENPDGTPKKKHWHVMLMFEGKKSLAQINEIRERVLGPNYNPKLENIGSLRGYARYLTHMDNPEKAQYNSADIRSFAGADYDAVVMLPSDDVRMLGDIMEYIRKNEVRYFSDFLLICRDNNPDWFNMLVTRKSYVVIEFIKSEAAKAKAEERAAYYNSGINPETGEVVGAAGARLIARAQQDKETSTDENKD